MARNSYDPAPSQESEKMAPWWEKNKCLLLAISIGLLAIIILATLLGIFLPASARQAFYHLPEQNPICYKSGEPSTYNKFLGTLNSTIEPYENAKIEGNMIDCNKNETKPGEVCFFSSLWLDTCRKQELWGFKHNTPCVILSYRDDKEFIPVPYGKSDELPEAMPESLKTEIRKSDDKVKLVWVSCNDAYGYSPYQGFPVRFFPIKDIDDYLPPLIAVDFDLDSEDELDVKCSLWSNTGSGEPIAELSFKIGKNC